jgi:hypothetical protein
VRRVVTNFELEAVLARSMERRVSWYMDRMVEIKAPIDMAAKTAPDCCMLKLWETLKTRGMEPNVRYKTAQANETQSEKKKTTGSVTRRSVYISARSPL